MSFESEQFQKFLQKTGLNQRDFAKIVGKNQSTIAKYVKGEYNIPTDIIRLLHNKFNMSYDWFFDDKGDSLIDGVEPQKTLMSDMGELKDTVHILERRLKKLTQNFNSLHAEYQATKQEKKQQNTV